MYYNKGYLQEDKFYVLSQNYLHLTPPFSKPKSKYKNETALRNNKMLNLDSVFEKRSAGKMKRLRE